MWLNKKNARCKCKKHETSGKCTQSPKLLWPKSILIPWLLGDQTHFWEIQEADWNIGKKHKLGKFLSPNKRPNSTSTMDFDSESHFSMSTDFAMLFHFAINFTLQNVIESRQSTSKNYDALGQMTKNRSWRVRWTTHDVRPEFFGIVCQKRTLQDCALAPCWHASATLCWRGLAFFGARRWDENVRWTLQVECHEDREDRRNGAHNGDCRTLKAGTGAAFSSGRGGDGGLNIAVP